MTQSGSSSCDFVRPQPLSYSVTPFLLRYTTAADLIDCSRGFCVGVLQGQLGKTLQPAHNSENTDKTQRLKTHKLIQNMQ